MPLKSDWSDSEEEKDMQEQNEDEEIEDWDLLCKNKKNWKNKKLRTMRPPNQAQNPHSHPHQVLKHFPHRLLKHLWTDMVLQSV